MTTQQPNIVLIMADQLAPQFTSSYGHPVVKTPHMDKLAQRGMRFDAAYCNAPLCAPSRFSFMSGQLVTRIAAYDNASEFLSSIPTFAHYLRHMGYRTCLSGKMHFVGPDQLHGFDERITTDIYPSDFAWTPDWELADERIDKWYHNMDTVREAGVAQTTFQIEYDEEVAFFARRKLFEYASENQHPFCMVASFIHPHDPYVARPEWWDLYDHDAIDMPTSTIPYDEQDGFSRRLMDGIEATTVIPTDDEIRNARHAYYANTSYFDSKVGHIVQTLEECGQLDNTIVIVTADHGDMLGERGLWYKMNFFEHSARVPMIMAGPGVKHGTLNSPCSLVDILPTMMDIAATDKTAKPQLGQPIDGRSLWNMATTGDEDHGEAIGEYCAEMTAHPVIMIRRDQFKYIHCDSDAPMLFDIANDPLERNNLVANPDYADLAQRFADEIKSKWDMPTIRADVVAKQKQRQAVYDAMQQGVRADWDYNPPRNASEEYVRNHMDWTEKAAKTRFPPYSSD
jgi:choline-sulfatase